MRLYQPLLPLLALLPVACTSSLDHSNYYIDATAGSDSNAGTSPEKPWKTFAPLASLKLSPGDSLLLRRGSVFDSRLELSASGSPEARIVVDAYGEGDAPRINAPDSEAAAGIWPWSCDNTVVRFNEASDHKAPWDAQGFDSDYNCRNTTIEYNYSHDNDGGFLLVCNNGDSKAPQSVGNVGTVVRYNISIGDAVRQRPTRVGKFSPTLHFAGPTDSTLLENNIFFADAKPSLLVDRHMVTSDSWGGHSRNFTFRGNVFLSMDPSAFSLGESTGVTFDGNYYIGTFSGLPADTTARPVFDLDKTLLPTLLRKLPVGNGTATLTTVDPDKITAFFKGLGE